MSCKAIIFFGCAVFFFHVETSAQSEKQSISWYTSFFKNSGSKDVGKKLSQAKAALVEASEIHDYQNQSRLYKEIGLMNATSIHDYGEAMDYFIKALQLEDSVGMPDENMFTQLGIALVFEEIGEHEKALESLSEALRLNEKNKDATTLIYIENRLGRINALLGRYDAAIENYEIVKSYKHQVDDPFVESEALFNLANVFTLQKKYSLALETHKQALALRRELKDPRTESESLNEIGRLYQIMKNDERALANHVIALEIRQNMNDKILLAQSYNNIGELYFHKRNVERAIANLQLALSAAQESQNQEELKKSYDLLSQCYETAGDYKKAFEFKTRFVAIDELIENERNEQRIAETQNRYVIDKKQSQIESLDVIRIQREKELATQLQLRNFLVAVLALGVIVIVLVMFLYVQKRRSNRELKQAHDVVQGQNVQLHDLNATKDKFFSIISHDLKGPLNSLTSFSGLLINHTDSLSKDEIKMLAADLDKSLKNLFALLENLLEWSRSQTGKIEFTPEAFDLAGVLAQNKALLEAQAGVKNIVIENMAQLPIPALAHKNSISTVIRNLLSNSIKFTPSGGKITLDCKREDNMALVTIADNGVGMEPEVLGKLFRIDTKHSTKGTANEKGTGLGLILCKDFVEKNGGRIWVESKVGAGSTFYFSVPVAIQEEAMAGV